MDQTPKLDSAYLTRIGFQKVQEHWRKSLDDCEIQCDAETGCGSLKIGEYEIALQFQTVTQLKWFIACFQ